MLTKLECYLGFSHFLGIGPIKFNLLQNNFKGVIEAFGATESQIAKLLGAETARKFVSFRRGFDPKLTAEIIQQKGIEIITREDKRFPSGLLQLSDAPICLYLQGDASLLTRTETFYFGVVGTRKGSDYGLSTTRKLVTELIKHIGDCCIVSGLAYGIDAVAHDVCLELQAKTIAFLGCGVDVIYPHGNRKLYERIIQNGGAVVSEFPPGETVAPGLFIARNRLISGISRGILVVEGTKTSGSLITARYAAEQGKDVFAVPGRIDSPSAEASHLLIKQGAFLTTSVDDILQAYDLEKKTLRESDELKALTREEQAIIEYLGGTSRLLDDIIGDLPVPLSVTLHALSHLEMNGFVERGIDERYTVKASWRV